MSSIHIRAGAGACAAPTTRRMLAAQLLAVLAGFPLGMLVLGAQVAPFFYQLQRAGLDSRLVNAGAAFSTYFLQGASFGLLQVVVLRAHVSRRAGWVVASGLLGVCLLPGLFPATAWLLGGQPAQAEVYSLPGLLLCAVAGGLFGLLMAVVQVCWLRAGAWRWMACSSLAWAILWAVAFPAVYRSIYL